MTNNSFSANLDCIKYILKPVIRLCLHSAIGIQEIMEIIKVLLVEVAKEEMDRLQEKLNTSRISVMTGLQRKDIVRILKAGTENKDSLSLVSRVLGQWEHDSRFCTSAGQPRLLSYEGDDSDFAKLVALVSTDVHRGTVLFELNRIGAIEYVKGAIKLKNRAQLVQNDLKKGYQILSANLATLIKATNENLTVSKESMPNLHAHTEYDNIFKEDLPIIREWLLKEGSELHQRARSFLAKFDRDINPHIKKEAGAKVSLTAFSHTEAIEATEVA